MHTQIQDTSMNFYNFKTKVCKSEKCNVRLSFPQCSNKLYHDQIKFICISINRNHFNCSQFSTSVNPTKM